MVEAYFREAPPDAVVLLVDGKVGATPLDVQAYEYLSGLGGAVIVVATKIDKVSRGKWAAAREGSPQRPWVCEDEIPVIPVSAHSGDGIKELWGAMAPHLEASAR